MTGQHDRRSVPPRLEGCIGESSAPQFRPAGMAIYFRTVTTDAYQGPNMANYFAQKLKVKKVFIIDDTGAYGVGIADAFEAQARKTA